MNEGSRFFIDTNIFIYSFDQTAPAKAKLASQLIRKALTTQKGVISFQVVQEFYNVALRRFSHPMNTSDAEQYFAVTLRRKASDSAISSMPFMPSSMLTQPR